MGISRVEARHKAVKQCQIDLTVFHTVLHTLWVILHTICIHPHDLTGLHPQFRNRENSLALFEQPACSLWALPKLHVLIHEGHTSKEANEPTVMSMPRTLWRGMKGRRGLQ